MVQNQPEKCPKGSGTTRSPGLVIIVAFVIGNVIINLFIILIADIIIINKVILNFSIIDEFIVMFDWYFHLGTGVLAGEASLLVLERGVEPDLQNNLTLLLLILNQQTNFFSHKT